MIVYAAGLNSTPDYPINTPIIGWRSLAESVTATSSDPDHPASYLTNPSTALTWRAEDVGSPPEPPSAVQYLTAAASEVSFMDYLAVAAHNLGSAGAVLSVEGNDGGSPETWTEIIGEMTPEDDAPLLFRWFPTQLAAVRLKIQSANSPAAFSETPQVGVLYAGDLLVLPRGTHTDHIPINLARNTRVMSGMSETGQFLGRAVLSESRGTSFALQHLDADWYDDHMDGFVQSARESTFFFAWRPQAKPRDLGYCWLTGDAQPTDQFGLGTKAITLQLGGLSV